MISLQNIAHRRRFPAEFAATLRLAGPLIATQLLMVAMSFVDTVMAGRLGAVQLAAVALGSSMWMLVFLACTGLMMGLAPSFAQLVGARRESELAPTFQQGIWLALGVGAVACVGLRRTSALMPLFGVDPEVQPVAEAYLDAVAWGMPAVCLYLVPRFLNEGFGHTTPVMGVQLVLLPLGILGNYAFMFGHLGAPALGAVGAGVSTAIGFWIGAVLMLAQVLRHRRYRTLTLLAGFGRPDPARLAQLGWLGLPIAASMVLETGLFATTTLLMGRLGAVPLGAHQVVLNYASLTFMVPLGIAMATTVRVGQAMGAGRPRAARRRGFAGIALGAGAMTVSATLMLLFPEHIIGLYTTDRQVAEVAVTLLFAAALFQVFDGLQVTAAGALRGYKDVNWPMLLCVAAYWMIGLPAMWWLGLQGEGDPAGLWFGLVAGLSIAALLLNLRFRYRSRIAALPTAPRRGH